MGYWTHEPDVSLPLAQLEPPVPWASHQRHLIHTHMCHMFRRIKKTYEYLYREGFGASLKIIQYIECNNQNEVRFHVICELVTFLCIIYFNCSLKKANSPKKMQQQPQANNEFSSVVESGTCSPGGYTVCQSAQGKSRPSVERKQVESFISTSISKNRFYIIKTSNKLSRHS